MFPVLFNLTFAGREIGLHTYGVLIAVGIASGISVAVRRARHAGVDPGRILDLAFWMTVAGLVGSRILYVLVHAGDFAGVCFSGDGGPRTFGRLFYDCTRAFQVWEGGLVFYGGIGAAALVAVRFARREGWAFGTIGDLFAPALALGHAFGRLGCLAAGCCFGKETATEWGVAFPRGSVAHDEMLANHTMPHASLQTPPLHPTQLYEAFGEISIFFVLMLLDQRLRKRPGTLFLLYLSAYALLRFIVEMFRGDAARKFLTTLDTPRVAEWFHLPPSEPVFLSVGQVTSIVVIVTVVVLAVRQRRTAPPAESPPAA